MRAFIFAGCLLALCSPAAAQLPVDVTDSFYTKPQIATEEYVYGRGPIKRITVTVYDPEGEPAAKYLIGEGAVQQNALKANLLKKIKAAKKPWLIESWERNGDAVEVHLADATKQKPKAPAEKYAPRPAKIGEPRK